MKKLLIYLSIIILLFALLYFVDRQTKSANHSAVAAEAEMLYSTTPDKLHSETVKQLTNPNYQNIIIPPDLVAKIEAQEELFVYFFSPLCSFCVATTERLNTIAADAGVDLKQFNILEFGQSWPQFNVQQTPTLRYYSDGMQADIIVGGFSGNNNERDNQVALDFKNFFERNTSE